jgi:hypothetical protein
LRRSEVESIHGRKGPRKISPEHNLGFQASNFVNLGSKGEKVIEGTLMRSDKVSSVRRTLREAEVARVILEPDSMDFPAVRDAVERKERVEDLTIDGSMALEGIVVYRNEGERLRRALLCALFQDWAL